VNWLSENELAWAAGFIDGEGYIKWTVDKRGYGRLELDVAQVVKTPLERLQKIFGGGLYGPYQYKTNKQPHYRWILHGFAAREAVIRMLPYFSVKEQQARKALDSFHDYQEEPNKKTGPKAKS
jgi:hypothetical protein